MDLFRIVDQHFEYSLVDTGPVRDVEGEREVRRTGYQRIKAVEAFLLRQIVDDDPPCTPDKAP